LQLPLQRGTDEYQPAARLRATPRPSHGEPRRHRGKVGCEAISARAAPRVHTDWHVRRVSAGWALRPEENLRAPDAAGALMPFARAMRRWRLAPQSKRATKVRYIENRGPAGLRKVARPKRPRESHPHSRASSRTDITTPRSFPRAALFVRCGRRATRERASTNPRPSLVPAGTETRSSSRQSS